MELLWCYGDTRDSPCKPGVRDPLSDGTSSCGPLAVSRTLNARTHARSPPARTHAHRHTTFTTTNWQTGIAKC